MSKNYITVPDRASNEPFTEFMWNRVLMNNLNNKIVPAMCSASNTSPNPLPTGIESTLNLTTPSVIFSGVYTLIADTDSMLSTANPGPFFNTEGLYLITSHVRFAPDDTGDDLTLFLRDDVLGIVAGCVNKSDATNGQARAGTSALLDKFPGETVTSTAVSRVGAGYGTLEFVMSAVWVGKSS